MRFIQHNSDVFQGCSYSREDGKNLFFVFLAYLPGVQREYDVTPVSNDAF